MFDELDVKITLQDLYDNGITDNNWSLIYRLYEKLNVSINPLLVSQKEYENDYTRGLFGTYTGQQYI